MKTLFQLIRLVLLTGFLATAVAQEVTIPDPALKSAIWLELGKPLPVGTLTVQDMLNLTYLHAPSAGVKSLEGLGAAQKLTTLYLHNNSLSNLTVPAGLTNLITLDLSANQLSDFTFLSGLPSLNTLSLRENELTNLTLPSTLTNLTALDLSGNHLTDFSFLSGLPNLSSLNLHGNY